MQTSGFTSTPTTVLLLLLSTALSLLASITSNKHQLPLSPYPHLYPYLQLQRLLTHQVAYTSSTELLFSSVLLYQLRVLERLFGTRKFVSFVLVCAAWEAVLAPLAVALVLRPLSWGSWDYVPAGMQGLVMAALAVWGEEVPRLWRWQVLLPSAYTGSNTSLSPSRRRSRSGDTTSRDGGAGNDETSTDKEGRAAWTITFSDKTPTYLLALQLSLSQFPSSLLPASTGYLIGLAWHGDFLPGRMSGWRVPRWMVGEASLFGTGTRTRAGVGVGGVERERYEGLRRRLEEEGGRGGDGDGMRQAAHATTTGSGLDQRGAEGEGEADARTRPMGVQIADYFRGVF